MPSPYPWATKVGHFFLLLLLLLLCCCGDTTLFTNGMGVGEKSVAYATPKWPQSLKMDIFLLRAVEAKIGQKNRDFENKGPFWEMENGKTEGEHTF